MGHIHSVYDTDAHFKINPITRKLSAEGNSKVSLVQFDHNSERFTFEIPKLIEGHDMSSCNKVEVHFINVDKGKKKQSTGVYLVDDMQVSDENEDVVIFSWLISRAATLYEGSLNFIVKMICETNEVIDYQWNTEIYSGISVSTGINNSDVILEDYIDVLEAWKATITEIPQDKIQAAVDNYLQEHPVTVEEQDPTVPEWAKADSKPKYTASEVGARPNTWMPSAEDVGALPASTKIPAKLSDMEGDDTHRTVTDTEKEKWNGKSDFSGNYEDLTGKPTIPIVPDTLPNTHKLTFSGAVTAEYDGSKAVTVEIPRGGNDFSGSYNDLTDKPTIPSKMSELANDSGYVKESDITQDINGHNTNQSSHNDIRVLIKNLTDRLNTLANSDDVTLDQMSEVVAYIKNNKSLIDGITTSKVNVSDIINDLTTNLSNKALSASMGVELKKLIDAIKVPVNLSELAGDATHRTVTDAEKTAWNNKSNFSGNYNDLSGKPTLITEERVNELINAKLPKSAEEVKY